MYTFTVTSETDMNDGIVTHIQLETLQDANEAHDELFANGYGVTNVSFGFAPARDDREMARVRALMHEVYGY